MSEDIKVFKLNDYEWYAAHTLIEAMEEAATTNSLPLDEVADEDARELTEEEMDTLIFYDDIGDMESSEKRTFKEHLARLIENKTEFPVFFAGTEY